MLTVNVPTTILCRCKTAHSRLRELSERYCADACDPMEYKCLRCHCEWDDSLLRDYREVVCSNCYSDRVILTMVRLGFENWGEQNGGEKEQRERYQRAVDAFAKANAGIARMKE
jgi:DNA-directed RNA polymerase subunit RPC12/RpoP